MTSFEIGDVFNHGTSQMFNFSGVTSGGSTLTTNYTTDSSTGLELVNVGWTNLVSFNFRETSGSHLQVDNFVVSGVLPAGPSPNPNPAPNPVPEPATMVLLGTGLTGLAAVTRRRKRQLVDEK